MLPYMMNFDLNKVATLNKRGLAKYEIDKANRKDKKDKITRLVIDSDDILILRFIYNVGQQTKSIRDKEDNLFFWVKYDALFKEYDGLLLINKSALNTRLNKYVDMGLIERKCIKNEDGSFSFFKLTGINNLIYIPLDSIKNKSINRQKPIDKVTSNDSKETNSNTDEFISEENKTDLETRLEQVERALSTKANKELKSLLTQFKDQYDFYNYFDNILHPKEIDLGKKNTCEYMIKNIKLYLNGSL